jgi:hypothetical protein
MLRIRHQEDFNLIRQYHACVFELELVGMSRNFLAKLEDFNLKILSMNW